MFRFPAQFQLSRTFAKSWRKLSSPSQNGSFARFTARLVMTAAFVAALTSVPTASAQHGPPAWDVYGGVAVQRYTPLFAPAPVYKYGWAFSLAQRAYPSHPWVAGEIEASGVYGSTSIAPAGGSSSSYKLRSDLYTAMAGPIVYLPLHKLRPFAHVLVGGVVADNTVSVAGSTTASGTNGYFGTQAGGGIDVRMTHHTWIRGQGDWIRIWQIGDANADTVRLTGGVVYTF